MNEQNEQSIFLKAREIAESAKRADYLDDACRGNTALRGRIEQLLRFDETDDGIVDAIASDETHDYRFDTVGGHIGPYKLLDVVGEGGMGTVFMAEQRSPIKRRVALKVIKAGMDSAQVIARFEAERQALSVMDHPNIAKVLDAGTTGYGRPYFVMELINGLPLTKYCDQHRLSVEERLRLFAPICDAVQHAHSKGVIHRDLKPSNVLIALYDGKPSPKVIDFGVAKATQQTLTEKTLFTRLGQVVGTFEYMSPEQAQRNQLDVDTRTDVYSLGAVLYELLTGTPPFGARELRAAGLEELLRIIRDVEPPRPSLRLSTSEGLPKIALNRRLEPRRLSTFVRGDLDWISMKALEKDRARRYETAERLGNDVRRFLEHQPIEARPPSATYRLQKLVRRHRAVFGFVLLASILLTIGMAGTIWQWRRAIKSEVQTSLARDRAFNAASDLRKSLITSQSLHLINESERLRSQDPIQSLLLAIAAFQATQLSEQVDETNASMVLREAFSKVPHKESGRTALEDHEIAQEEASDASPAHARIDTPESLELASLCGDESPIFCGDTLNLVAKDGSYLRFENPCGNDGNRRSLLSGKCLGVDSTGHYAAVSSKNPKQVRLYHLQSDESVRLNSLGVVTCAAIGPGGNWCAVGGDAGETRLWKTQGGLDPSNRRISHGSPVISLLVSPNGRWLFANTKSAYELWHLNDLEKPMKTYKRSKDAAYGNAACFSSDNKWIAVSLGSDVLLWNLRTPDNITIRRIPCDSVVQQVIINNSGSRLLAQTKDESSLLVWQLPIGSSNLRAERIATSDGVTRSYPSANGRWLCTISEVGIVRLWDLDAEDLPFTSRTVLRAMTEVRHIAISNSGDWMATVLPEGNETSAELRTYLWPVTDKILLQLSKEKATRMLTDVEVRMFGIDEFKRSIARADEMLRADE